MTIGADTTWWLTTGTEWTEWCTTGVATNLATGAEWWTTWLLDKNEKLVEIDEAKRFVYKDSYDDEWLTATGWCATACTTGACTSGACTEWTIGEATITPGAGAAAATAKMHDTTNYKNKFWFFISVIFSTF